MISESLAQAVRVCLQDHTTNQHGDVGSLVRMEAIDAVTTVLHKKLLSLKDRQELAATVCGLAVEKLDKVRIRAWKCLQPNWDIFEMGPRPSM